MRSARNAYALSTSMVALATLGLIAGGCSGGSSSTFLSNDGPPSILTVGSGNNQSGPAGSTLAKPLVVKVTDLGNNPVVNMTVNFQVTSTTGGSVSPQTVQTDANGLAQTTLTLPKIAGPVTVTVTAPSQMGVPINAPSIPPVTFSETATPGTPSTFGSISGDGQQGVAQTQLSNPLVVTVLDGSGNAVPNSPVTFTVVSGGGSVTPTSVRRFAI